MNHRKPDQVFGGMEIGIPPSQPLPPPPPLRSKRKPIALHEHTRSWADFGGPRTSAPPRPPPPPAPRWQSEVSRWQTPPPRRSSADSSEKMSFESGVLPPAQRPRLDDGHASRPAPPRANDDALHVDTSGAQDRTVAGDHDIQAMTIPASRTSSIYSTEHDLPLSEPARTLGIFEREPARRASLPAGPRSPSLHHFETIPARRSNYNEHSVDVARDLYHATATQLAVLTRGGGRSSTLSFADNVGQTGRRRGVPARVETGAMPASTDVARTPYPPGSGGSRFDLEETKVGRRERYSGAFSRVFRRRSSEVRSAGGDEQIPERNGEQGPIIPMRSRRASGPDTPRPIFLAGPGTGGFDSGVKPGPASPGLLQKINRQWNELLAQAKRTSGHGRAIAEEERRREALKGKIKVLNDGARV
ncbi:hypothetical protein D7B24_007356 [Verticillium nonalfalfae]|uniref:Uncharacterized protein n=1 Tax=Verticillium nonalfalfae TaxID=1051616 RepID=A0A3M9Y7T4_9PEZI|nr:uncharacterized protein D7B24_007356 [Verticillium nonalfalfae]RNJ56301.1 hypothetical protein D7B24_007356 [Verticillium nonalfalfae]